MTRLALPERRAARSAWHARALPAARRAINRRARRARCPAAPFTVPLAVPAAPPRRSPCPLPAPPFTVPLTAVFTAPFRRVVHALARSSGGALTPCSADSTRRAVV
ncbi:hypothetical protein SSP531S_18600 [Streptomyces spongiicola]|uniref:Uncharacterized protein n=1 Tax=Streptomyces spongiicola TaxID=1690221 RepID=A0A388SWM4_9ACTN|nr:hypothetical protein SSP531S_18600 [Streptomyces spongiicola]